MIFIRSDKNVQYLIISFLFENPIEIKMLFQYVRSNSAKIKAYSWNSFNQLKLTWILSTNKRRFNPTIDVDYFVLIWRRFWIGQTRMVGISVQQNVLGIWFDVLAAISKKNY
jgi:hypothetical protein